LSANVVFSLKLDVRHQVIPRSGPKIYQWISKGTHFEQQDSTINIKKAAARMVRAAAGYHCCWQWIAFLLQVEVASAYQVAFIENFNLVFAFHKILTWLPCATHLGFSIGVVASSGSGITELAFVAFVLTYA